MTAREKWCTKRKERGNGIGEKGKDRLYKKKEKEGGGAERMMATMK